MADVPCRGTATACPPFPVRALTRASSERARSRSLFPRGALPGPVKDTRVFSSRRLAAGQSTPVKATPTFPSQCLDGLLSRPSPVFPKNPLTARQGSRRAWRRQAPAQPPRKRGKRFSGGAASRTAGETENSVEESVEMFSTGRAGTATARQRMV